MMSKLQEKENQQATHLYRVLVVDDDSTIRDNLKVYLCNYHPADYQVLVEEASTAQEAIEKLEAESFDLVMSDINLPDKDGFYILQCVRENDAGATKTALITSYDMETYIDKVQQENIHNVLVKTAPFNFSELSNLVDNLLFPEKSFGLERYIDAQPTSFETMILRSSHDIIPTNQRLRQKFDQHAPNTMDVLDIVIIEALTNAVYHSAKKPDGSLKYQKGEVIDALDEAEYVTVTVGVDDDKIGISIVDQGGTLKPEELLYWISHNVKCEDLLESHGRGLFLMHRLMDRMIINIDPGQQTELILLHYFNEELPENKPLFINTRGR